MFCDEPTSGLDSYMAQSIIEVSSNLFFVLILTNYCMCSFNRQVLKSMASNGKTVICTVHQPSSVVFALFDRILLMADGRTAFLGPSKSALEFFSSQVNSGCSIHHKIVYINL